MVTSLVERRPSFGFTNRWRASFNQALTPMENPFPLAAPEIVQNHDILNLITKVVFVLDVILM